jgi:hypothetical protein
MTPEQEGKLDALIDDVRDGRRDIQGMSVRLDLVTQQVVSLGREVGEHGQRIQWLEAKPKGMSHSVTNEISEVVGTAVGDSIRVAAPEVAKMVNQGSILRSVVTGIVLALAILAAIVLERH